MLFPLTLSLSSLFTTVRFLCVGSFTFLAAYVPKSMSIVNFYWLFGKWLNRVSVTAFSCPSFDRLSFLFSSPIGSFLFCFFCVFLLCGFLLPFWELLKHTTTTTMMTWLSILFFPPFWLAKLLYSFSILLKSFCLHTHYEKLLFLLKFLKNFN